MGADVIENSWLAFMEFLRWLQSLLSQSDLLYLTALVGFFALGAPFYKKVAVFMYKSTIEPIGKFFSTFATLPDRLQALETKINNHEQIKTRLDVVEKINSDIRAELTPNHGTSIKDVVNQLAVSVNIIDKRTALLTGVSGRLEARQQNLLNTVSTPTFETDATGGCVFANKAYLALTGRTLEETKGLGWVSVIHPDDRERVQEHWAAAVRDNRAFELTFRTICRRHRIYEVECEAIPISGTENGYFGRWLTVKNITDDSAAKKK